MIDYFIFHNCISREAYVAEAAARNALVGGRQGAWVLSDFHHSVNRKKNTQPEGGMGGRHTPPPHR